VLELHVKSVKLSGLFRRNIALMHGIELILTRLMIMQFQIGHGPGWFCGAPSRMPVEPKLARSRKAQSLDHSFVRHGPFPFATISRSAPKMFYVVARLRQHHYQIVATSREEVFSFPTYPSPPI